MTTEFAGGMNLPYRKQKHPVGSTRFSVTWLVPPGLLFGLICLVSRSCRGNSVGSVYAAYGFTALSRIRCQVRAESRIDTPPKMRSSGALQQTVTHLNASSPCHVSGYFRDGDSTQQSPTFRLPARQTGVDS